MEDEFTEMEVKEILPLSEEVKDSEDKGVIIRLSPLLMSDVNRVSSYIKLISQQKFLTCHVDKQIIKVLIAQFMHNYMFEYVVTKGVKYKRV